MSPIETKTPAQLARMREAGRLVAEVLRVVAEMAAPGVTTAQLDQAAEQYIEKHGARPAFKGYRGFPATICASIDEEVVHGIPGARELEEGQLLKVDVGTVWKGYYGDGAVTIPIGQVTAMAQELMEATREALSAGIAVVRPGVCVHEISAAVQQAAERRGFSVVRQYTGHGIGKALHEEPTVPNFVAGGRQRNSPVLQRGSVVAIEPMLNVGSYRTEVLSNGWTVVTKDRELSAHFEHTVAVDGEGAVILTLP